MSIPQTERGMIENPDQLVAMLEDGCKPRDQWRIGTEHEKFGWLTDTRAPLPFAGARSISALFTGMIEKYGWQPVHEGDKVIGLSRNHASISLEPGGQFELSGAPLVNINETRDELDQHLAELRDLAEPLGIRFMAIGAPPEWAQDSMPMMPKGRYRLMTDYMDRVGTRGRHMMYRSATVQVNLDFASEADMVKKLRVGLTLQPMATALFASSPFFDGKVSGNKSERSRMWQSLDASRTGMLPFAFAPGMGFQAYVDWVLDAPMYFVYRDNQYIDALGQSFRDFLRGELPALPGERPTLADWADHLTTVFPEARVKKFIEMRGADCGDRAHLLALPAFWTGIIYNQAALDAAWDLVRGFSNQDREQFRVDASIRGLQAEIGGMPAIDLARAVTSLSHAGLAERGLGEESYLDPLMESLESGQNQADRWLSLYNGEWNRSLTPIYDAASLF